MGGAGECSTWNTPLFSSIFCSALRGLLARLAVDPDGHGAIVRQRYLHVGAEATRADGAPKSLLKGANNLEVEGFGDLGTGGTDVGWAVTFLRLCHEGELRYGDDVPTDVEDTAVHHSVFVVEDTQLCGLLHEVLDVLCGVFGRDADEDEHAEAVALGDGYSVDVDGCGAGALDEEAHGAEFCGCGCIVNADGCGFGALDEVAFVGE